MWDKAAGIIGGTFIEQPDFCVQNSLCGKCLNHYIQLQDAKTGFYVCPYGLSTLIYEQNGFKVIFTGFRERETYRKKGIESKQGQTGKKHYNPILPAEQILSLAYASFQNELSQKATTEIVNFSDDIMHEIRALNSTIKSKCDIIWTILPQAGNELTQNELLESVVKYIRNIHSSAYMIQSRFMLYDYFRNPDGQSFGDTFTGGVYKKFDKIRMILSGYSKKQVKFHFVGTSRLCYPLHSSFEILVFSVMENAIKYSPDNCEIRVIFREVINAHSNKLSVIIESTGPYCEPEELSNIFLRGVRGKYAKESDTTGTGIGLFLSKTLSDLHNISLEAESSPTGQIDGVPYGTFSVKMLFDETLLSEPEF